MHSDGTQAGDEREPEVAEAVANLVDNTELSEVSADDVEIATTLNTAMAISCAMDEAIANSEASGCVSAIGSTTAQGSSGVLLSPEHLMFRFAHNSMKGRKGCLRSSDPIGRQSMRRSVRNLVTAKPGAQACNHEGQRGSKPP